MKFLYLLVVFVVFCLLSCEKDMVIDSDHYVLNSPKNFPPPSIPNDNPLTKNKILLGRHLFFDKRLSSDKEISCNSCHKQEAAFGSNNKIDLKVNHGQTLRNSSTLFNLVYTKAFFWDGRTKTLESTCDDALLGEQNFQDSFIVTRLMKDSKYITLFDNAYKTNSPNKLMIVEALSSFIRTMISSNSKVDRGAREGNPNKYLNAKEIEGREFYETEVADCFHCHGDITGSPLMTDNLFHNNGLDIATVASDFKDAGLGEHTKNNFDYGKFKTPPLRNLSFSFPYMHDGRMATLDDVLSHYDKNIKISYTIDVNMKKANVGGLKLLPSQLNSLKAYLLSFDDNEFIKDTAFSNPW